MTQSLKKLALSLVIATSVTATSFAEGSGIFNQELEVSQDFSHSTNFDVSTIFDNQAPRKLDDSFNLEKIAQSKISFNSQYDTDSLLGATEPKIVLNVEAITKAVEDAFFTPSEGDAEKMAQFKKEAEDREKAKKLAEDNAVAQQMAEQVIADLAAKRAAAEAPSALQVLGGYAYSAGKVALSAADYGARSWVGAYLMSYGCIELLEEGVAYAGYAVAGGLTTWYSCGNVAAGQVSGNTAYYGIKAGFKIARTVLPGFEGVAAFLVADKAQAAVNLGLDAAPAVAGAAYSAASTAYSATSSAVSYIRSFWG